MKKLPLLILLLLLVLTACGKTTENAVESTTVANEITVAPEPKIEEPVEETPIETVEYTFTGTVLALTPTTALVKVDADCDLYAISDQVTFHTKELEDFGIAEGDRVAVGCGANIRETYPAQLDALIWELLESPPAEPSFTTVQYDNSGDAMSVQLPAGWVYEEVAHTADLVESLPMEGETLQEPTTDATTEPDPNTWESYSIIFWPEADPDCKVELRVDPTALDLSGVETTAEERLFGLAGAGMVHTAATEAGTSYAILFACEDGRYSVRWTPSAEQLTTYEAAFWEILDTITVGNEV